MNETSGPHPPGHKAARLSGALEMTEDELKPYADQYTRVRYERQQAQQRERESQRLAAAEREKVHAFERAAQEAGTTFEVAVAVWDVLETHMFSYEWEWD